MTDFWSTFNWSTVWPTYAGFQWPTNPTENILIVISFIGSLVAEGTANLSAFAREGMPENGYSIQLLCLDSLGEMLFGVFSVV